MARASVHKLERMVQSHLGVARYESSLGENTHPAVWGVLNHATPEVNVAHRLGDNPIRRMNHNLAKLSEEHIGGEEPAHPTFGIGTALDPVADKRLYFSQVRDAVAAIPDVAQHLRSNPGDLRKLDRIVRDAFTLHQIKSPFYWKESTGVDPKYHGLIASAAEGIPLDMNRENARGAAIALNKRMNTAEGATLMDVGFGPGNTTRFTLEELVKLQQKTSGNADLRNVKLVLNCVEPSLKANAEKMVSEFTAHGLKPENVTIVNGSFYAAAQALNVRGLPDKMPWDLADAPTLKALAGLKGKVDVMVSGAAFNNLPLSRVNFATIRKLLRKGGEAHVWDWGGYDTTRRAFRQKDLDRKIPTDTGSKITVRENIKGFWRFWLEHHGYTARAKPADAPASWKPDEKMWTELETHIDTAPVVDVYKWLNENADRLEAHRGDRTFTYFGNANRAYRTPEDWQHARQFGFSVMTRYPMADKDHSEATGIPWKAPNPRFVTVKALLVKR